MPNTIWIYVHPNSVPKYFLRFWWAEIRLWMGLTFSKKLTVFVSPASSCEASPTLSPDINITRRTRRGDPLIRTRRRLVELQRREGADPTDGEGGSKPKKSSADGGRGGEKREGDEDRQLVVSICKDFAFMNIQPVNFSVIGHPVAVGLLLGLRMHFFQDINISGISGCGPSQSEISLMATRVEGYRYIRNKDVVPPHGLYHFWAVNEFKGESEGDLDKEIITED
ncbi:hypothetical protein C8J57DRAFT_1252270 [Mycena rebaudengoi]|nr:hypothetical protein C8J57DRAFT_1252270 [Mycena rebaudengoi]